MDATKIWYFEEVDLYNLFCPHKYPHLKDTHKFYHFKKDQFIYLEEDTSRYVFLIACGRVRIGNYSSDGKEVIKAILTQGEIFGEMALAGETKRNDFAMAMEDNTSICPLTIQDMQELMAENKAFNFKIIKLIGLRLQKMERRIESLLFKDARTRIIEFLRDSAEEIGKKVGYETLVKNNLTHKDIANLTGTSRQTVTTVLNELKNNNVINFDRRRILIRDMDLLK